MSKAPSMPMFWDAYLADTTHLTTEEHGAYLLLLAAMWRRNGTVPDNDKDNARILGLTKSKWIKIKHRLSDFLTVENDQISQKNLQKIWKKTQENIQKNRENGVKGGRPVSNNNNNLAKPNGYVSQNPNKTIPKPEPIIRKKEPPKPPTGGNEGSFEKELKTGTEAQEVLEEVLKLTDLPLTSNPRDVRRSIEAVRGWIDSGAIPDKHIYPAIKQKLASTKLKINSLGFFTEAILAAINRKTTTETDTELWEKRITKFKEVGKWDCDWWGSKPGEPGCFAPKTVLQHHGYNFFEPRPVES